MYVGFDPTADAIHVGNLLGIIVLSWFQRCGHNAVALLGGATGLVGDPSGKSAERPVLSEEEVARNVAGIGGIVEGVLDRNRGGLAPVKVRACLLDRATVARRAACETGFIAALRPGGCRGQRG